VRDMGGLCGVSARSRQTTSGYSWLIPTALQPVHGSRGHVFAPSDLNPVPKPADDCSYGYVTKQ